MSSYLLKSDSLTIQLEELGAELISIFDQNKKIEYLWNADPAYWKRHSPVLFPFVGTLKNKSYEYQGQVYSMLPHGFARDMKFTLRSQTEDEIWFSLEATDETKKVYPFDFQLELGYRLQGRTITVLWKVINKGQTTMYYSIGAHPAFYCPLVPTEDQTDYYISFHSDKPIHYLHIDENGLVKNKPMQQQNALTTDHGIIPVDPHMFDYDALIIEDNQCNQISLLDPYKKPYVTVKFDAPLFGLWSPAKKNAPFLCIEPWYGRCDASDFEGALEDRKWGNSLEAGKAFEASYTIEIA